MTSVPPPVHSQPMVREPFVILIRRLIFPRLGPHGSAARPDSSQSRKLALQFPHAAPVPTGAAPSTRNTPLERPAQPQGPIKRRVGNED